MKHNFSKIMSSQHKFHKDMKRKAENIVDDVSTTFINSVRRDVPIDTSDLLNSIVKIKRNRLHASVIVNSPHAKSVEFGSGVYNSESSVSDWWFYTKDRRKIDKYFSNSTWYEKGGGYIVHTFGQPAKPFWQPNIKMIAVVWSSKIKGV